MWHALLKEYFHLDRILLQVIVRSNSYIHAIQKMQRALYEFHIRGVKTNILFLENVLRHPEFLSGQATTSFIDDNPQLFDFHQDAASQSSQLLTYLGDLVSHSACSTCSALHAAQVQQLNSLQRNNSCCGNQAFSPQALLAKDSLCFGLQSIVPCTAGMEKAANNPQVHL